MAPFLVLFPILSDHKSHCFNHPCQFSQIPWPCFISVEQNLTTGCSHQLFQTNTLAMENFLRKVYKSTDYYYVRLLLSKNGLQPQTGLRTWPCNFVMTCSSHVPGTLFTPSHSLRHPVSHLPSHPMLQILDRRKWR